MEKYNLSIQAPAIFKFVKTRSKGRKVFIPANEMIFYACAVFLTRCSVRFRLRTIKYAALNLPCLVSKILAHPTENHFVRGYSYGRNVQISETPSLQKQTVSEPPKPKIADKSKPIMNMEFSEQYNLHRLTDEEA